MTTPRASARSTLDVSLPMRLLLLVRYRQPDSRQRLSGILHLLVRVATAHSVYTTVYKVYTPEDDIWAHVRLLDVLIDAQVATFHKDATADKFIEDTETKHEAASVAVTEAAQKFLYPHYYKLQSLQTWLPEARARRVSSPPQ